VPSQLTQFSDGAIADWVCQDSGGLSSAHDCADLREDDVVRRDMGRWLILEPVFDLSRAMGQIPAGGQLHHRETKTPGSDAPLPLPGICTAAFKLQAEQQARWQADAGPAWHDSGLVISTRYGTPYEPRNFLRYFVLRCGAAQSGTSSRTACGAPVPHSWRIAPTWGPTWPLAR
jgi:hypothetical protein